MISLKYHGIAIIEIPCAKPDMELAIKSKITALLFFKINIKYVRDANVVIDANIRMKK